MRSPRLSTVDLFEQSGLDSPRSVAPSLLGTKKMLPTQVGRLSHRLSANDTHIILHKDMEPVASPDTQRFLVETARTSENSSLMKSQHPVLQLQFPGREIRPRYTQLQEPVPQSPMSARQMSSASGRRSENWRETDRFSSTCVPMSARTTTNGRLNKTL